MRVTALQLFVDRSKGQNSEGLSPFKSPAAFPGRAGRARTRPSPSGVDRHGYIASARLSGEAVSLIVKERVAIAGIDPSSFSGHSLRAGFATSAVQAVYRTFKIRQQTGHASDAMLSRYVREGELFLGNAAGALL